MSEWPGSICFAEFHQKELISKKRSLYGVALVEKTIRACAHDHALNGYILDNIEGFYSFIDIKLDELYSSNYSFYASLYGSIKSIEEINAEFPKVHIDKNTNNYKKKLKRKSHALIKSSMNKHPFNIYADKLQEFKTNYDFNIDFKADLNTTGSYPDDGKLGFKYYYGRGKKKLFNYFVEDMIAQTFLVFVLQMQNPFRVSRGVPKIGEGWVSETDLYYKLKEGLNFAVIHHGRPQWLGRQHFDIWIPELNVAIEYQGKQHDQPIEFFGGEEAFKENQKRDARKKKKCEENNVRLIEVREGYVLDDLISQILNNS